MADEDIGVGRVAAGFAAMAAVDAAWVVGDSPEVRTILDGALLDHPEHGGDGRLDRFGLWQSF